MTFVQRAIYPIAHFLAGYALMLTFSLYFIIPVAASFAAGIAIGKESIESIWGAWDPKQPWSGAVHDVAEFLLGIIGASILLFIKQR